MARADNDPVLPKPRSAEPTGALLLAGLAVLVSAGALAALPSAGAADRPVAIVFAPWLSGSEAVSRSFAAGQRVLRQGRLESIVIVAPSQQGAALPKGAWFTLSLSGLAGCLDRAETPGELS